MKNAGYYNKIVWDRIEAEHKEKMEKVTDDDIEKVRNDLEEKILQASSNGHFHVHYFNLDGGDLIYYDGLLPEKLIGMSRLAHEYLVEKKFNVEILTNKCMKKSFKISWNSHYSHFPGVGIKREKLEKEVIKHGIKKMEDEEEKSNSISIKDLNRMVTSLTRDGSTPDEKC